MSFTDVVTWIEKDDELETGVFTGIKAQCSDSSHELHQLITGATETDTNQHVEWQCVTCHLQNNTTHVSTHAAIYQFTYAD